MTEPRHGVLFAVLRSLDGRALESNIPPDRHKEARKMARRLWANGDGYRTILREALSVLRKETA